MKQASLFRRQLSGLLLLPGMLSAAAAPAGEDDAKSLPPAATTTVDFAQHIAPIFQQRCLHCHGPDKPKSELRLDSLQGATVGGYSGAVIVSGQSAESLLVQVVAGVSEDDVIMPPEGEPLTPAEIGLLRAWIDQGAPWPEGLVLTAGKRSAKAADEPALWAFRPIQRSHQPEVQQPAWPRNPIDRFILSRLESEGIAPSPEVDRATLIRRVSFDLIGLPPTPAEVAAFVNDSRPEAYERLVDRLLASPHYGEKWARQWLDLCHYADSDGYLQDMHRPVAWRYRQWLVDALNRDLPFDQFTIEQLAGDLLSGATSEQKLATGFLRNTLSNREGGADLEEYRVEQVADRTMMVGTTWLGLTVGCARCHDHKYDPISQKEFYQLFAYLDSADEANLDAPLPSELAPYLAARPEYDRQRADLLEPLQKDIAPLQAAWEKKLLEAVAQPGKDHVWDRHWEVLGLTWGQGLGEGQLEGTQIVLLDPAKRTPQQKDRIRDYFLKNGESIDPEKFQKLKLAELRSQLAELEARLPKVTRAPAMRETQNTRSTYLQIRGDFRRRGVPVEPNTPAAIPSLPNHAAPNRLALAMWLVSPDNPLPARVTVNRFWQELFGQGLVLTSENFGTQGERPTHPELLDWLAAEFISPMPAGSASDGTEPLLSSLGGEEGARGWSMKAMHRLMVTSATYRQSSQARPELATRDPNNRLLARQSSLRLSADQVRDTALAVSGLLDVRLGGPSVFPPQPASVAMEGFENKWQPSDGRDRYRRGLYTFLQRLSPFAQNVTFDAPALSRICSRRERSNSPLQALTLLNDPVFFEAAQNLSVRILRERPGGLADRVEYAFLLCLSRPPSLREKERLSEYYQKQMEILRADPTLVAALCPSDTLTAATVANATEGLDPVEVSAWTGLSSVLLNLHEFITRE